MTSFPNSWTHFSPLSIEKAWEVFEKIGWMGGTNINARVHGKTPIHHLLNAISWNSIDDVTLTAPDAYDAHLIRACQTLLEEGLSIESKDDFERTLFLEAVQAPIYFMAFLLNKGANPFAEDKDGNQFPYYLASNLDLWVPSWKDKINWLKSSGLDLTHRNHKGQSLLDLIESRNVFFGQSVELTKKKQEFIEMLVQAHILKEREQFEDVFEKSTHIKKINHL